MAAPVIIINSGRSIGTGGTAIDLAGSSNGIDALFDDGSNSANAIAAGAPFRSQLNSTMAQQALTIQNEPLSWPSRVNH